MAESVVIQKCPKCETEYEKSFCGQCESCGYYWDCGSAED